MTRRDLRLVFGLAGVALAWAVLPAATGWLLSRGGALIARSLAVRPPPAPLTA